MWNLFGLFNLYVIFKVHTVLHLHVQGETKTVTSGIVQKSLFLFLLQKYGLS